MRRSISSVSTSLRALVSVWAGWTPDYTDIRVLRSDDVARLLDAAVTHGTVSRDERRDLLYTDLIVRGKSTADGAETYLVVEISAPINELDVMRATRRADVLRRASGLRVLAAVARERIRREAHLPLVQVACGACSMV
jgi:hypothetical protein